MPDPAITVYGAHWCPDCRTSRQFLGEHRIPYRWVDVEDDPEAERFVLEVNRGKRIVPTIVLADGSTLAAPSNAALAAGLGLRSKATRSHYDLMVVGGGPAGLTTALYAAREGVGTLVIERAALGGQVASTERLDNVPGFADGVSGADWADALRRQAQRFGTETLQAQEVSALTSADGYHRLRTADGSEYTSRAVVLATGSRYRRLEVPGEESLIGAGIHFCATCDGPFYRGRHVAVVGGGNSAAEESMFLAGIAERVTLLVRGDAITASRVIQDNLQRHPNIEVRFGAEVVRFEGVGGKLQHLVVRERASGATEQLVVAGAFVFIGLTPNTGFLDPGVVRLDARGFVRTGHGLLHDDSWSSAERGREPLLLETSVPGIFAAGDVRCGSTKQVVSAAGEGATAALMVREYLRAA